MSYCGQRLSPCTLFSNLAYGGDSQDATGNILSLFLCLFVRKSFCCKRLTLCIPFSRSLWSLKMSYVTHFSLSVRKSFCGKRLIPCIPFSNLAYGGDSEDTTGNHLSLSVRKSFCGKRLTPCIPFSNLAYGRASEDATGNIPSLFLCLSVRKSFCGKRLTPCTSSRNLAYGQDSEDATCNPSLTVRPYVLLWPTINSLHFIQQFSLWRRLSRCHG